MPSETYFSHGCTMPTKVEPDLEMYGKYGRVSALADYLELLALLGLRANKAELADYISDNSWTLDTPLTPGIDFAPSTRAAQEADPGDDADKVFALLRERSELLAATYPFDLTENDLTWCETSTPSDSPYVAVLAIALLHGLKVPTNPQPEFVFEEIVAASIRAHIPLTVHFSARRRGFRSFDEAVVAASAELGLRAVPDSVTRSPRAFDDKADTISHIAWGDLRCGSWVFIGQATCAKSDEWVGKITETSEESWARILCIAPPPQVFLAIPHHVEEIVVNKLLLDRRRVILDRPRLTRFLTDVGGSEQQLIEVLMNLEPNRI